MGGVNDTADQWWAVSMTPRINIDYMDPTCSRLLFSLKGISITKKILHRQIVPPYIYNICEKMGYLNKKILVSSVIDTADYKIGEFKVEFLG
jgi:hypothetical protein